MLSIRHIFKLVSCLLLVCVHISFTFSQLNYQSSVLRYGLQLKQPIAKQSSEKESPGTGATASGTILVKSKPVPGKRLFQHDYVLIVSPECIAGIDFPRCQCDRYASPPINIFSACSCLDRGPPVVA
jgi:hypothetical protein